MSGVSATVDDGDADVHATHADRSLIEGQRVGRYLVLRDLERRVHAVAAGCVTALCETDDGSTLLMRAGGRLLHVPRDLATVLAWLDGRGS